MSTAALPLTADDLLALPDAERFELVDGQLLERPMGIHSTWTSGEVFGQLRDYVRRTQHGWAFTDGLGYACYRDPDQIRRPDASYIRRERLPSGLKDGGYCRIPPDIAIEVISPGDVFTEVETKIDEYLEAGVQEVWILSPHSRTAIIHRRDRAAVHLRAQDELTAPDLLPGFACRVGDLFPPAANSAAGS